jgi:hypothetical protein
MPLKLQQRPGQENWYIMGTYLGKLVRRSTGVTDRKQAEIILAKRQHEIFQSHIRDPQATVKFVEATVGYRKTGKGDKRFLEPLNSKDKDKDKGIPTTNSVIPLKRINQARLNGRARGVRNGSMARRTVDDDLTSDAAMPLRLKLTRDVLGCTTTQMCRLMGSSSGGSAYTNYEMGYRIISIAHAITLARNCGLSLDWIYLGKIESLPERFRQRILDLLARQGL